VKRQIIGHAADRIDQETVVTVSGSEGVRLEYQGFEGSSIAVLTEGKEYLYAILGDSNLTDQILSTFRFIEPIDTSDWQTYNNEEFGFEVKYPADWTIESSLSDEDTVVFGMPFPGEIFIYESIGFRMTDLTLEEWQAQELGPSEVQKVSETTFNGERALRIETGLPIGIITYVKHNGVLYSFPGHRLFNNGMLSTFRFLE